MVEDTGIQQYEHRWAFVIIPVQDGYEVYGPGWRNIPKTYPLLSAYCKHCDTYQTTPLEFSPYATQSGKVNLPRFGCLGPEGRF